MRVLAIARMLGLLLLIFSISLLPPMAVYVWYRQGTLSPFIISFALCLIAGAILWLPTRNVSPELKSRDGFLVVVLVWLVACLVGAIPFISIFIRISVLPTPYLNPYRDYPLRAQPYSVTSMTCPSHFILPAATHFIRRHRHCRHRTLGFTDFEDRRYATLHRGNRRPGKNQPAASATAANHQSVMADLYRTGNSLRPGVLAGRNAAVRCFHSKFQYHLYSRVFCS